MSDIEINRNENNEILDLEPPSESEIDTIVEKPKKLDKRKKKNYDPEKRSKQLEQLKLARQRKKEINDSKKAKKKEIEARITKEMDDEVIRLQDDIIEEKHEPVVVEKTKPKPRPTRPKRPPPEPIYEEDDIEEDHGFEGDEFDEDPPIEPQYPSRIPMPNIAKQVRPVSRPRRPPPRRPPPQRPPSYNRPPPAGYYDHHSAYSQPQYQPQYQPQPQPRYEPHQGPRYDERQQRLNELQQSIFGSN